MSRLRLVAIAAFALVLALPASVLAATVDVTGTVTAPDGVSVAGVEIAVLVQGTDQIIATTTDEAGAWALQVEAEPGAVLDVRARRAPRRRSEPDEDGCVTLTTPIGRARGHGHRAAARPDRGAARRRHHRRGLQRDRRRPTRPPSPTRSRSRDDDAAVHGRARHGRAGHHGVRDARRRRPARARERSVARPRPTPRCTPGRPDAALPGPSASTRRRPPGLTARRSSGVRRQPREPAPSIQPAPRVTRRTRRSSSSSTRCARRPGSIRPRSDASRSAAGFAARRRDRRRQRAPLAHEVPDRRVERDHRPGERLRPDQRRASVEDLHLEPADRPAAVAHPRERQRVGDEHEPVRGLRPPDDRPQRRVDVEAVRDQLHVRAVVRERRDREAREPVVDARHRVEQVGRRAAAGSEPCPRLLERRRRVTHGCRDPERRELVRELQGTRQLGGDRHDPQAVEQRRRSPLRRTRPASAGGRGRGRPCAPGRGTAPRG